MKRFIYFIIATIFLSIISACNKEAKITIADGDGENEPAMATYNVTMLISDSGVIKYKATSKIWLRYEADAKNIYQYFPEGIHFAEMDSAFNAVTSIEADTAYNLETAQLWHLINNVHIINKDEEHFYTNDLYWDMKAHTVYSDSFIRIERPDAILEGYGFNSDDQFSQYVIRHTSGIFPINAEATKTDSTQTTKEP